MERVRALLVFVGVAVALTLLDWLLPEPWSGAIVTLAVFAGLFWLAKYGFIRRFLPSLRLIDFWVFGIVALSFLILPFVQQWIGDMATMVILFSAIAVWAVFFLIRLPRIVVRRDVDGPSGNAE